MGIASWHSVSPISCQRAALVEHCSTGQQGFRAVRWEHGQAYLYGPVYSGPDCRSAAFCREVGIPTSQADEILCE